jgi:hypothetical protein
MLKKLTLVLIALSLLPIAAEAQRRSSSGGSVYVRGDFRKNGTHVPPHHRSAPDGNPFNNWTSLGNINPLAGAVGTPVCPPPPLKREFHKSRSHDLLLIYGLYPATLLEPYSQPDGPDYNSTPSYDFSRDYKIHEIRPGSEFKLVAPQPAPPAVVKAEPPIASGVIDLPPLVNSQVVWLEPLEAADKKEETVYITRAGERYHRESCQHLRRSKIAVSKKEALANGYTPCRVCKP